MNGFMNNRYVQLAGLTIGIGLILYILLAIVINIVNPEIPGFVPFIMAFGVSVWFVWKYMAYKVG